MRWRKFIARRANSTRRNRSTEDALTLARELGDRESIAIALLNLAMVSIARGFGERAPALMLEVSAIVDEIGSKPLAQSVLEVCAGLAAFGEEWERAARFYGAVEAQSERTGLHRDPADQAFLVAADRERARRVGRRRVHRSRGQWSRAPLRQGRRWRHARGSTNASEREAATRVSDFRGLINLVVDHKGIQSRHRRRAAKRNRVPEPAHGVVSVCAPVCRAVHEGTREFARRRWRGWLVERDAPEGVTRRPNLPEDTRRPGREPRGPGWGLHRPPGNSDDDTVRDCRQSTDPALPPGGDCGRVVIEQ